MCCFSCHPVSPSANDRLQNHNRVPVLSNTHGPTVFFNPLPDLPLSPCQLALPDTKHGVPVCRWCMLMCGIHLFVCLIWILLIFSHLPAPPTSPSPPLCPLPTPPTSPPFLLLLCLLCISFLLFPHQGARLPGSLPALTRSGRGRRGHRPPCPYANWPCFD